MRASAHSTLQRINSCLANIYWIRLLVALFSLLGIAAFLHFRAVRLDILAVNTASNRPITAQLNFKFPDYENTILLKQRAMQEIGKTYQIQPQALCSARQDLTYTLIRPKEWRSFAPSSNFEELYQITEEIAKTLQTSRFTDARTLQIANRLPISHLPYHEFSTSEQEDNQIPQEFWGEVADSLLKKNSFHTDAIRYVTSLFQSRYWPLEEDHLLQRSLKSEVSHLISQQFIEVAAGTHIIDPGEQVTSKHLDMMQAMREAIAASRKIWDPTTVFATLLLSFFIVLISMLYLRASHAHFYRSTHQLALFAFVILLTLVLAKSTESLLIKGDLEWSNAVTCPLVVPFAAILLCLLFSPSLALFGTLSLSVLFSLSLAMDHHRFLIVNLFCSITAIISSSHLKKRNEIFLVAAKTWLSSFILFYSFTLSEGHVWTQVLTTDLIASAIFLFLTAILVVGILPALETLFGVVTDLSLVEYMNPNTNLLRRLATEVPGTYQHCLALANLTEACAQAIGAHDLRCRAASLYHDIGKLHNPQFYAENQVESLDLHQLLTPIESAQVIIAHVKEGEALARKHRLPQFFIDIIRQHHGTTLTYYFYRKQQELLGPQDLIDKTPFCYPGPKPQTKEAAIIMICDSAEAASRSLEEINEESLSALVARIVRDKVQENQFEECPITFGELHSIQQSLVRSLLLAHHTRVPYPKREILIGLETLSST